MKDIYLVYGIPTDELFPYDYHDYEKHKIIYF